MIHNIVHMIFSIFLLFKSHRRNFILNDVKHMHRAQEGTMLKIICYNFDFQCFLHYIVLSLAMRLIPSPQEKYFKYFQPSVIPGIINTRIADSYPKLKRWIIFGENNHENIYGLCRGTIPRNII